MNRLGTEKSPYLLQHAHNPVDWYPWGDEPFERARRENKPVFLSIGYSTCYWCHVMERLVFENEQIARLMNEHLICVKVDREERPDVDHVYMSAVQALTGAGGWPMSVFLTPDRKPFYAGTYFPPGDAHNRPGFPSLVRRIAQVWTENRDGIMQSADEITAHLLSHSASTGDIPAAEFPNLVRAAFERFSTLYDPGHGGFGGAPKFPRPSAFNFLLRYFHRTGERKALDMTVKSVHAMAAGGVHDQLGGGFHRYSVDAQWRIPHFEKMLYDQAQIVIAALDAYKLTRDELLRDVVESTLDYVLRDLTSPEGGFYSAEDAESAHTHERPSEREEGTFYVWERGEIESLLGPDSARLFCLVYGAGASGNALHDPQRVFVNKNILFKSMGVEFAAAECGISVADAAASLAASRHILFEARLKRPRPHLDDKIITAWNGLMISAFARAGAAFHNNSYTLAAERAASFVLNNMTDQVTGRLFRRYRDGESRFSGTLQDFAFFIQGLLDLFESAQQTRWILRAERLMELQIAHFAAPSHRGFVDAATDSADLLFIATEDYDGAEPSGSAISALNLLRLSRLLGREEWHNRALDVIGSIGGRLSATPEAAPQMLCALEWVITGSREVVVAGDPGSPDTRAMLNLVNESFLPNSVQINPLASENGDFFRQRLPFLASLGMVEGRATGYICREYACELPVTEPAALADLLNTPGLRRG